jgi:predicted class III extradiol MEMO1 family dioxygenase
MRTKQRKRNEGVVLPHVAVVYDGYTAANSHLAISFFLVD